MKPGEIHLAKFPFGGKSGAKLRPVLLLTGPLGTVPEVLTAYMTSVVSSMQLPTDIRIDPSHAEHASTNLSQVTLLRIHKLATLHNSNLVRRLGEVSSATWAQVETRLRILLKLP